MADINGESSLCDKLQNSSVLRSLFQQKNDAVFCDVIMKVCGKEIYAHSNVLAAASPYFHGFLGIDLPRQFSQRSPQVIEIQIDGSEQNMLYDEAVSAVVDFIYTGVMAVRDDNVSQIAEIARIMQMDNIVKFCESFSAGKVNNGDFLMGDNMKQDKSVNTMPYYEYVVKPRISRGKKLRSISVQVMPNMLSGKANEEKVTKDTGTSTERWPQSRLDMSPKVPRKRGRPRKNQQAETVDLVEDATVPPAFQSEDGNDDGAEDGPEPEEVQLNSESGLIEVVAKEAAGQTLELMEGQDPELSNILSSVEQSESAETTIDSKDNVTTDAQTSNDDAVVIESFAGRSARSGRIRKLPQKLRDTVDSDLTKGVDAELDFILQMGDDATGGPRKIKLEEVASLEDLQNSQDNVIQITPDSEIKTVLKEEETLANDLLKDAEDHSSSSSSSPETEPATKYRKVSHSRSKPTSVGTDMLQDVAPTIGKYSCDSCDFMTNKVREMSNHRKLHKFEQNTCYYCDLRFDDRDELTNHMEKHKGPNPFFCPTCHQRFKTRTILNMHLPKHSNEKPFICEICSAAFKWKHALKGHMITHSNKKEHLCDTCGYATAHKSQLKAHRLIHTGDLFKCEYADCDFQCTKKQNLKYHLLTHTREKPHQCEVCGQAFSLVKNMRRHMLLHSQEKNFRCDDCDFASTRYDKLKEHRLKQHGFGTAPEKRIRTSDLVYETELAPTRNIKYEGGEDEQLHAAVMLQAIEEEQVMAEIEKHVSNVGQPNIIFQVEGSDKQLTAIPQEENMIQLREISKDGSEKIVNIRPDQLQDFLPGSRTVSDTIQTISSSQPITLQTEQSEEGGIQTITYDASTPLPPGIQATILNSSEELQTMQDSGAVTYMSMSDGQDAFMTTSDGTIVKLDTATVLTTEDGTVIPQFSTAASSADDGTTVEQHNFITEDGMVIGSSSTTGAGDGQALVLHADAGADSEGVQYAEIMVQGESGEMVRVFADKSQLSL